MADPTTETAVAESMVNPRRVSGETGSVESHSIPDLIAAQKHVAAQAATATNAHGITIKQLVADGA